MVVEVTTTQKDQSLTMVTKITQDDLLTDSYITTVSLPFNGYTNSKHKMYDDKGELLFELDDYNSYRPSTANLEELKAKNLLTYTMNELGRDDKNVNPY